MLDQQTALNTTGFGWEATRQDPLKFLQAMIHQHHVACQIAPNASIPCYAHHVAITLGHFLHISTFPQVVSQAFGMGRWRWFMLIHTKHMDLPNHPAKSTCQQPSWGRFRRKVGPKKVKTLMPGLHHVLSYSVFHSLHKSESKNCPCFFVKRIGDQKSGSIEGCSFHFHEFLAASKLLTHLLLPQT